MRAKLLIMLEALLLGLGMLVLTPSINPTPVARASTSSLPSQASFETTPAAKGKTFASKSDPEADHAVWECVTSWYGDDFDGLPTATGETYDMYAATAAHPTLPLGSIVRVVNTRNHRSQVVRINDRGPYVEGRELDVSYAVARSLGFEPARNRQSPAGAAGGPKTPRNRRTSLEAPQLIVALDVDRAGPALALAKRLRGTARMFKVGSQLFTAEGPAVVEPTGQAWLRHLPRPEIPRHPQYCRRSGSFPRLHPARCAPHDPARLRVAWR